MHHCTGIVKSTMCRRWFIFAQIFLLLRLIQPMPGSSNNYKISPKPCSGNSYEGTCMFVWECIKSEGQHIGMCVDSFMFGSCCAHNLTENAILTQTIVYKPTKPFNSHKHRPPPSHSYKPSLRLVIGDFGVCRFDISGIFLFSVEPPRYIGHTVQEQSLYDRLESKRKDRTRASRVQRVL